MSIVIGNIIPNVVIPTRQATRTGSSAKADLFKAMDALEIGTGFDYVVTGSPTKNNPEGLALLKNQYANVAADEWAPKGKTFKVYESEDREGLEKNQARFIIARVDFVEPKKRAKKVKKTEDGAESGNGEAQANTEDAPV